MPVTENYVNDMTDGTVAHYLDLPLGRDVLVTLRAGDRVFLSGPVFTMRDAGHLRALESLVDTGSLPHDLAGHTLFYAGPTPTPAGRVIGSVGPTTASRMDGAAPTLYEAGIVATIGKGARSVEVAQACIDHSCVYFVATGGAAALLSTHITAAVPVAWDDLGTEALVRLELRDFPVFVGIDVNGASIYEMID